MSISNIQFTSFKDGSIQVKFESTVDLKSIARSKVVEKLCDASNVLYYTGEVIRKKDHRKLQPIVVKNGNYYECTEFDCRHKWLFSFEVILLLTPLSDFKWEDYGDAKKAVIQYAVCNHKDFEKEVYAYMKDEMEEARNAIEENWNEIYEVAIGDTAFSKEELQKLFHEERYKVYRCESYASYSGYSLIAASSAKEANEIIREFQKSDKDNHFNSWGYASVTEEDVIEGVFSNTKGILEYGIRYSG